MTAYPTLFSPIRVGSLALSNRIVMGSMHTGLEELPSYERLAGYFAERARAGVQLMVTGAFSPNAEGNLGSTPDTFDKPEHAELHRVITGAVHGAGSRILLQLIHAGRYSYHPNCVAPSPIQAPINRYAPRELTADDIERTIGDFVNSVTLARDAGYDGVEIMGSEGYLISQFVCARTNKRDDDWGGTFENRIRFPLEIVRRVRAAVGPDFVLMYRLSVLDIVDGGCSAEEVVTLAREVEAAGADVINSGIGWHEAKVPTITQAVPRGAFADYTEKVKAVVGIPVVASNRINTPEKAEEIVALGKADLVSMARPFLADPAFVEKARDGRADEINTCIACNQACLDHYFTGRECSCLVNPRACRETEFNWQPAATRKRIAVVGAGPAGLPAAVVLDERGHQVTLFEAQDRTGGQFNVARNIPGKYEFDETLRYFRRRIELSGIDLKLNTRATADDLIAGGFDAVVLASGIEPRRPDIAGIDHPSVAGYLDILTGKVRAGERVVIIGGGGIAFDTALYLLEGGDPSLTDPDAFRRRWGIGGAAEHPKPRHAITMVQRSGGRMGTRLGKTTGWVHQLVLKQNGVRQTCGVTYDRIDDAGLHLIVDGRPRLVEADTIAICAGQLPLADLAAPLTAAGVETHLIGGAAEAVELDAKRAFREGTELAARL